MMRSVIRCVEVATSLATLGVCGLLAWLMFGVEPLSILVRAAPIVCGVVLLLATVPVRKRGVRAILIGLQTSALIGASGLVLLLLPEANGAPAGVQRIAESVVGQLSASEPGTLLVEGMKAVDLTRIAQPGTILTCSLFICLWGLIGLGLSKALNREQTAHAEVTPERVTAPATSLPKPPAQEQGARSSKPQSRTTTPPPSGKTVKAAPITAAPATVPEPRLAIETVRSLIAQINLDSIRRADERVVELTRFVQAGEWGSVVSESELFLQIAPLDVRGWMCLAQGHCELGDHSAEVSALVTASRIAPGDADVALALAGAYEAQGRWVLAQSVYRRCLAAHPFCQAARNRLASLNERAAACNT